MAREFDSPWKDALDLFFEQLLALLFPDLHALIDWSKGYENLDTQLSEIVREAELGRTAADKLFRVVLLDGEDAWLLIHVEVQVQPDSAFPERMFKYYYRIFDRYNRDVLSLAILGDDRGMAPLRVRSPPLRFRSAFSLSIGEAAGLDWRKQELLDNPSPIALVILAHLYSLETHHRPEERRTRNGSVPQTFRAGLDAGRDSPGLPSGRLVPGIAGELEEQLKNDIRVYEEERHMPYVTSLERMGREEGREEGRAAILDIIEPALESKYGEAGVALLENCTRCSTSTPCGRSLARLRESKTIDELRAMLPKAPNSA